MGGGRLARLPPAPMQPSLGPPPTHPPTQVLLEELPGLVGGLSFRKSMRWRGDAAYSRPLRWLVALHGGEVVPFVYGGLVAGERRGLPKVFCCGGGREGGEVADCSPGRAADAPPPYPTSPTPLPPPPRTRRQHHAPPAQRWRARGARPLRRDLPPPAGGGAHHAGRRAAQAGHLVCGVRGRALGWRCVRGGGTPCVDRGVRARVARPCAAPPLPPPPPPPHTHNPTHAHTPHPHATTHAPCMHAGVVPDGTRGELLSEVTNLVESPTVVLGGFDPGFLTLPREVLVMVMRKHQRYFPVCKPQSGGWERGGWGCGWASEGAARADSPPPSMCNPSSTQTCTLTPPRCRRAAALLCDCGQRRD